jgi:hypothetical protein
VFEGALSSHPHFIPAEAIDTELPRQCLACKNARNASMDRLSFKANVEYEVIFSKLQFVLFYD